MNVNARTNPLKPLPGDTFDISDDAMTTDEEMGLTLKQFESFLSLRVGTDHEANRLGVEIKRLLTDTHIEFTKSIDELSFSDVRELFNLLKAEDLRMERIHEHIVSRMEAIIENFGPTMAIRPEDSLRHPAKQRFINAQKAQAKTANDNLSEF